MRRRRRREEDVSWVSKKRIPTGYNLRQFVIVSKPTNAMSLWCSAQQQNKRNREKKRL